MRTLLVSLLLAFAAVAAPVAEAADKPCVGLVTHCPALVCRAYDPQTGYRAHCVGEPMQCIAEPCGYVLP